MRYTVNIDIENDAFQPDWQDEVNRLLLVIVKRIENDCAGGDLKDLNGNLCGSHGLRTDKE